jgi:uncharacterized protein YeaO (DUF488 family)
MGQRCRIRVKRVYDPPEAADGRRILVDRVWPRGVSKSAARLDAWVKEAAPSAGLRTWFSHDPAKWAGFVRRYFHELDQRRDAVGQIAGMARTSPVCLVFAARDRDRNNAAALKRYLEERYLEERCPEARRKPRATSVKPRGQAARGARSALP